MVDFGQIPNTPALKGSDTHLKEMVYTPRLSIFGIISVVTGVSGFAHLVGKGHECVGAAGKLGFGKHEYSCGV